MINKSQSWVVKLHHCTQGPAASSQENLLLCYIYRSESISFLSRCALEKLNCFFAFLDKITQRVISCYRICVEG